MPRRRRSVLLGLGAAIAVLAPGRPGRADELSTPPADAIFVRTERVAAVGEVPAGLVRTTALPVTFDFVEEDGFPTASMTVGARRLALALIRGRGDEGALLADVNGDGRPSRADESFPVSVSPWMVQERAVGLLWKAEVAWGAGSFGLTIRDRIGSLSGQWTATQDGSDAKPAAPVPLLFDPEVPTFVSKTPTTAARVRYSTIAGSGGERSIAVAALRGAKDELSFLLDAESAGDLSDLSLRIPAKAQPLRRGTTRTGTSWTSDVIRLFGVTGVLTAVETMPTIQGIADPTASRSGSVNVAGDPWTLVLLDGDFDGGYTGACDWWGFAPTASIDAPNPNRLFEGDSPSFRSASRAWRLLGVRADGTAVLAPFARAPSVEEYLERRSERVDVGRWFPKFEVDREEFMKGQGVDVTRPRAASPVAWRHALTFEDARALAKADGRPLLVDFEADWCIWCKRLDWAVYPDREVAEQLSRFTAVKVNIELDPTAGFQSIEGVDGQGWGGLPAIGVFDADGRPVRFRPTWNNAKSDVVDHIDGFKRPEEFAAALAAAHEAVRGAPGAAGAGGAVAPGMDGPTK